MKFFFILLILVLLWALWSIFISRAEQMTYTVLEKRNNYEIRQYDPYIAATVQVADKERAGMNSAFRILAGYIFGGNLANQNIAMTAPVIMEKSRSESIAMTAPVITQDSTEGMKMTFSMPKKYTLETLPQPLDERIVFTEVPSKKFAVYQFSWYYTDARIQDKKTIFMTQLEKEGVKTIGEPMFAGYNGPGTIPFMMRNEIMVELIQ